MKAPIAKNNFFPLTLGGDTNPCSVLLIDDNWLWHHRFGHLNFKSSGNLAKENMVHGLPFVKHVDETCESYVFGKQHWDAFPKGKQEKLQDQLNLCMQIFVG